MTQLQTASLPVAGVRNLLYLVYFIYFFCGLTQSFESVFMPEFKEHFRLTYQEQMYTMFARNIPFLMAVPIGYFLRFTGYRNCMSAAMLLFSAGTFLLISGIRSVDYRIVLLGFFLIGIGFNCEIVSGNPMLSGLGDATGASSRLNLGNAFGAVAQIFAPAALTLMIPAAAVTVEARLGYVDGLFAVLGAVLALIALVTAISPNIDVDQSFTAEDHSGITLFQPRLLFGFLTITVCLGVEAGQFGFFRNFVEDSRIAGLSARSSEQLFTVYFSVFAAGRLIASWVQKRISPERHVILNMLAACGCLAVAILERGSIAIAAVIVLAFFTSILFPTLYAIAIRSMGLLTGKASGLLTMGFIGCAVIPVAQGRLADSAGLQNSYVLGFAAYLCAIAFSIYMLRTDRTA
jgi:FHS family L-fucose permease-like MFS transporter